MLGLLRTMLPFPNGKPIGYIFIDMSERNLQKTFWKILSVYLNLFGSFGSLS